MRLACESVTGFVKQPRPDHQGIWLSFEDRGDVVRPYEMHQPGLHSPIGAIPAASRNPHANEVDARKASKGDALRVLACGVVGHDNLHVRSLECSNRVNEIA